MPTFSRPAVAAFVLIAVMMGAVVATGNAQSQDKPATLSISGPSNVQPTTESVDLSVDVADASNLGGFQFVVSVDSGLAQLLSIEKTDFLAKTGREIFCQDPTIDNNAARYVCVTLRPEPAGVDGKGSLAVVKLKPLSNGSSPVRLSHVKLVHPDGTELPSQTIDGNLTVGGSGGGSGVPWWLIVVIAVPVALVVIVAAATMIVRRRGARRGVALERNDFGSDPF